MHPMKKQPYQTIEAITRKHQELADYYAETAAAEALEAGKVEGVGNMMAHQQAAAGFLKEATEQTRRAEGLKTFLSQRRAEAQAPSIEKVKP